MNVCVNNKSYIMIELMFLKELMSIRQVNQESFIFDTWYFLEKGFKFQPHFCNNCYFGH